MQDLLCSLEGKDLKVLDIQNITINTIKVNSERLISCWDVQADSALLLFAGFYIQDQKTR